MVFRKLDAKEIECRVQSVKSNGLVLLLYKDARCDMNILDEAVGVDGWQRRHEIVNGNLFCNVGIRFERKDGSAEWVWKQDVGTESNTEKEKGQASDSFKRSCFNWGIGRELYTAPFIWVNAADCNIKEFNGKKTCNDKFVVERITYDGNSIDGLSIKNVTTGKRVFLQKPKEDK